MSQFKLHEQAKKDILKLKKENTKLGMRLLEIFLDISSTPFSGIGKPEPLKNNLSGWWSRRLTDNHRIIYRIKNDVIEIASCYGHYED